MPSITVDTDRFDRLQLHLLGEIVRAVRAGLSKAGVKDDQLLFEATGDLSFAIAAIVDGSLVMELDGQEVVPILAFAEERDGDQLVGRGGASWMHEYVFGTVDEVFAAEDDASS